MVIKRPGEVRGESAAICDRPASSLSKFSEAVNPDLRNGSFWVKIRDAKARQVFFCISRYTPALIFANQSKKRTPQKGKCALRFSAWNPNTKFACPHWYRRPSPRAKGNRATFSAHQGFERKCNSHKKGWKETDGCGWYDRSSFDCLHWRR